jgi:polysaccharide biosynthesis/export protein
MVNKTLTWIALSLTPCCLAQVTLITPSSSSNQCIGSDCQRRSTDSRDQDQDQPINSGTKPEIIQAPRSPQGPTERNSPGLQPDSNLSNFPTMPPYAKTEFEKYVMASTGRSLNIFGQEFFQAVPTTFAPLDRVPVPVDYTIGPGDQLLIRAWGKIDLDARVVVDRMGQIYLPRVGPITVVGLRADQLNGFVHSAIGRFFRDFDVDVSIGQMRSIEVFVLGYARRPGTYTVSSLSNLVNALFESGGPAANGSMRHIQLKRNNAVVTDLDLYDLVLRGDKSGDTPLQPGDVIYIPRAGPLVAVSGSVNRPAIYELRDATTLGDVLEDSGGLTSVAGTKRVSLDRLNDHIERMLDEFALDVQGLKRELKDGDIVRIYAVSPRIANAVTLRGNVAQPGHYLWHEGMRVSDLIPDRDALITWQYWTERNNIVRNGGNHEFEAPSQSRSGTKQPMNGEPAPEPELRPQERGENRPTLTDEQPLARSGQPSARQDEPGADSRVGIKQDNTFDANENPLEQDFAADIRRRASDINWDYAVVERTNKQDLSTRLIPFNLANAIDQPQSDDNQHLLAGDVVTIFSQKDIPVSTEIRTRFVQIEGEIKSPGVYRVNPGETLRDVVRRAGGLSAHAYLYGAELHRVSTLKVQKKQLAQMVERMQRELVERAGTTSPGLSPADSAEERSRLQEQRDFISKLARVEPTGRVVMGLQPTDSTIEDVPTMALEDGDKFLVPARLDTIEVFGSVYNENAFRFKPRKLIPEYVNNAGGFSRGADKGRVFVIRADGTVTSRQQHKGILSDRFDRMRLMPGDAIVVPQQFRSAILLRGLRDWTQIFGQLALGAAAINVLR